MDLRVISATNGDLNELPADKLFRQDLYDRLAFAVLKVSPLRRRRDEIPHMIVHFVQGLHEGIPNLQGKTFHRDTVAAMMDYHWPGNIRELKNIVERVYVFGTSATIMPSDLPVEITGTPPTLVTGASFHEQVDEFKRSLIMRKLAGCGNNQRVTASELKMTYNQFRHCYSEVYGGVMRDIRDSDWGIVIRDSRRLNPGNW